MPDAKPPDLDASGQPMTGAVRPPDLDASGVPVLRTGNAFDAAGNPIARDDPGLWGRLHGGWTAATTPLLPQIGQAADALAELIDRPNLGDQALNDRIPGLGTFSAQLRGFAAGATHGAGEVLTSMTAPVGIALWLAGIGEESAAVKVLPALKPFLNTAPVNAIRRAVQGVAGLGFTGEGAKTVLMAQNLGDVGRGVAQMAGGAAGALSSVAPRTAAGIPPRLSPEAQASNALAVREGIPLSLSTATGNRWFSSAEKLVANSVGGAGTAADVAGQQQAGLTALAPRLAGEINAPAGGGPGPRVTPEQAGQALSASLIDTIGAEHGTATQAYSRLRALEADPRYAAEVPAPKASADAQAAVAQRMRSALGYAPNTGELAELRRMAEEMGAQPFVKHTWVDRTADAGKRGNAGGGDYDIVGGSAGAPVYDDILGSLRSSDYVPTRNHVERMIRDTLETGQVNEVSRAAFDVAQRRLAHDPAMSKPTLPPSAGVVPEAPPVMMGMPVSLEPLQDALAPDHARLMAEAQVAPLMGSKADAARILDRLMQSPKWVPVSVGDAVRSELGRISAADVPALRTDGQAIAAKAFGTLSDQIDEIVGQVPGASDLLQQGRAATTRKFAAGDVLKQLREAPEATFSALTGPTGLHLLRQVAEQAPDLLPQLGRAKFDQLVSPATTESGRWQHAARISADWERLGPENKALLFGSPAQVQALDEFFLLQKRLAGQPTGSDTAYKLGALNLPSAPITWLASKVLYTKPSVAVISAINNFLAVNLRMASGQTSGAAREAAWAGVAMAAQKAGIPGVPFRLPLAAGPVDQPDTRPGQ